MIFSCSYVGRQLTPNGNYRLELIIPKTEEADDATLKWQKKCQGKGSINLEINEKRKGRSLDANSYCWLLCDKIAQKVGSTRVAIYKRAVYEAGEVVFSMVTNDRVQEFNKAWTSRGIGWICEPTNATETHTTMACYIGSSVYDTAQMTRLIEWIVEEAKELGIETMSQEELNSIIEQER